MDFEYDGVKIPFNKEWNKIAISLSGGADSALLAYILCDIASNVNPNLEMHIISHIRVWKTRPWQSYDSKRVFEYLSKKFNQYTWFRHTNFIAPDVEYGNTGPILKDEYGKMVSGDNAQIRAYSEYVCFYNRIDAYYNAVTKNPKNVEFKGMKERDIEKSEENKHLEFMEHMGVVVSHPFRFTQKDWVLNQYKKLGILDLFNITRSCEGNAEGINYLTYKEGDVIPTCNKCFWCQERNWAIKNVL